MTEPGPFRVLHVCTGNICRSPMAEPAAAAACADPLRGPLALLSAGRPAPLG